MVSQVGSMTEWFNTLVPSYCFTDPAVMGLRLGSLLSFFESHDSEES